MVGNWQEAKLVCIHCNGDIVFRFAYKKAQFLNGTHWDDIVKSAEIVLCPHCGATIYISSVKTKAEL